MSDPADVADLVERSRRPETGPEFERRVERQADRLRRALAGGAFDNEAFTIGLELEAYAVDAEGRLARVPADVFEAGTAAKELGLHNVELNTAPTLFDGDGIAAGAEDLAAAVDATRDALADADCRLVLDGMWTIPPAEGTRSYLGATETVAGQTIATNMRPSPRYAAIDNDVLERAGGAVSLRLPGTALSLPTILVESLTSSIQPHLQVPDLPAFDAYYAAGIRTLGPVLALATNSPFLPADLYGAADGGEASPDGDAGKTDAAARAADDPAAGYGGSAPADDLDPVADPEALLDATFHELRIPVFEQSINVGQDERKVRFPEPIVAPETVVDRLEEDLTCAPFLKEWIKDGDAIDGYADRVWELDHKRGTYWRWLRAVVGGEPLAGVSEESLRIEYRPLPTQPTVAETVACQALVSGLLHGLLVTDHPVLDQDHDVARANFYRAVEDGIHAELAWVDAEGDAVGGGAGGEGAVYEDLLAVARAGLADRGLDEETIEEYLGPIAARVEREITPSTWKIATVRERLASGEDLRAAIEGMQRTYIENAAAGAPVTEW